MLEILTPYLSFIAFFIALVVNVLLIVLKSQWYVYIIANAILTIIMLGLGITPYDLITDIVDAIVDLLISIFEGIF